MTPGRPRLPALPCASMASVAGQVSTLGAKQCKYHHHHHHHQCHVLVSLMSHNPPQKNPQTGMELGRKAACGGKREASQWKVA